MVTLVKEYFASHSFMYNKYIKEGRDYAELELWIKNQNNINCIPGKGVVELLMREFKKA